MTDEAGSPVAGAFVALNHGFVQGRESSAGTLVVDVRGAGGSIAPLLAGATSGNYAGQITRPGPSTVSIPVSGGTYRIFIGVPEGTPAQRVDVTTSVR